ncbi:MAG: protein translocase subunit SecF [Candidatus Limnocylindrales bacterium]
MFDLIGKRRIFFLISAIALVPGIIALLLGPLTGGRLGLQFSIDYTGGTIWQIHFQNGTPDPAAVKRVLDEQGLSNSSVSITTAASGEEYILMRLPEIGLRPPAPTPTPVPTISPSPSSSGSAAPSGSATASASASAGASASPAASASPVASPSPTASASPSPSASAGASPSPSGSASPSPSPSGGGGAGGTYTPPTEGKIGALATALEAEFGPIDAELQQTSVGPVVSADLIQQAFVLILLGSVGILLWITVRFRDVRMGATALAALVHDVIVVVGTFAILGTLFGTQIDALFVTAMLTVIGFSVHDTIVVYDRIRENRSRHAGEPFAAIVNHSLLQTLGRSINTSLTVVITLTALLLFGGEAIRVFVLALLIGIVSGTYSSIFNASPLLVVWHEWDDRRRARTLAMARTGR